MKRILKFRLGESVWSLSLGEYLILLVAVLGGWLAGRATLRKPVSTGHVATHYQSNGMNAAGVSPVIEPRLASD